MIARLGRSALRVRPRDVVVAARTRLSSAAPAAAPQPPAREAARDELGRAYATGRRKSSSARVWVFPGDGRVRVNGRNMVEYFKRATHVDEVIKPFLATKTACAFDVRATVAGGGLSGQAGAIRLGVARALLAHHDATGGDRAVGGETNEKRKQLPDARFIKCRDGELDEFPPGSMVWVRLTTSHKGQWWPGRTWKVRQCAKAHTLLAIKPEGRCALVKLFGGHCFEWAVAEDLAPYDAQRQGAYRENMLQWYSSAASRKKSRQEAIRALRKADEAETADWSDPWSTSDDSSDESEEEEREPEREERHVADGADGGEGAGAARARGPSPRRRGTPALAPAPPPRGGLARAPRPARRVGGGPDSQGKLNHRDHAIELP